MSLLLDALKKTGQAQPSAIRQSASSMTASTLMLESLPETPRQETARVIDDDLARKSGHNLFATKSAHARPRISVIPFAVISGLMIAAGGVYYVWREISLAPPVAPALVTPIPVRPAPTDSLVIPEIPPAVEQKLVMEQKPDVPGRKPTPARPASPVFTPAAVTLPLVASPAKPSRPTEPIRIEHTKETAAIDPALLAGYAAYRNGDLDKARQHYGEALQKDASSRDALLGLAAIAQQQSQDAAAVSYYRKVLALDPRDPVAHAGISALLDAGDTASTESRLKLLLSQQPQSAALHFTLGNYYAGQSRWSEAQQAYFEAARLAPDNGHIVFNLAVSLDHLEQHKLAAQYYQRALQTGAPDASGFNRAQVQQRVSELMTP